MTMDTEGTTMTEEIKVNDKRGSDTEEEASVAQEQNVALSFSSFILSLATSAMIQMGKIADPMTNKTETNFPLAKQQIDIIEMLAEKTKNNRSKEEDELLEQVLYQLRMQYVEVNK